MRWAWFAPFLLAAACNEPLPASGGGPATVGAGDVISRVALDGVEPGAVVAVVLPPKRTGRPDRVAIATRSSAAPEAVIGVLMDVERYPDIIDQVRGVRILERTGASVEFELELEVPLNNLVYGLRYRLSGPLRLEVEGTSGAVRGGRYCWEVFPDAGGSLVVYTSQGELTSEAGVVLNAVLSIHPDLQEGLAFSQGLRFLRAICAAAEAEVADDA